MNKQEYLSAIRVRIPKMPTEDMERFIAYYSEMIDDRMEDGMTEEEAVAMMDTPDDAVDQILEEKPKPEDQTDASPACMGDCSDCTWFSGLGAASAYSRNSGIKYVSCCIFTIDYILCSSHISSSRGNCGSFSCGSIPDDQQCSGSGIYAWVRIRRCRTYDSVLCRSEAGNGGILESV